MTLPLLAAALLALQTAAGAQQPPVCPTLDQCLARLGTEMKDPESLAYYDRLRSLGEPAVEALLGRLDHPDPRIASAAGLALAQFRTLDPRHLPRLIRAHRRGNGWMPRAIAATGSDEAVAYVEALFLANPDFSNNTQVHFALARLGERVRPFLLEQLEACRNGAPRERCQGVFAVLGEIDRNFPEWAIEPVLALAAAPQADETVRRQAGDIAIRRRHPAGLVLLAARLERGAANPGDRWELTDAIRETARYGTAAAMLGPRIVPFLAAEDADLRADAALALGRIGSAAGAGELVALEPRFEEDWLLAYNAVEALGRMGASEARPLLERVRTGHWHAGVRNNAVRAINRLAGGAFERPGEAGDGAPYPAPRGPRGEPLLSLGKLRYAGDVPRPCELDAAATGLPLAHDPPAAIAWPARGAERLQFQPLAEAAAAQVRGTLGQVRSSARVPFRMPLASGGFLAGYDQGEWGGGVVHVRADGTSEKLADGNARGAFRLGDRLYVIHGLDHMGLDKGAVSVLAVGPPRLIRSIRLPGEPEAVLATDRHAVLIRTRAGDLAIREDGRLADPASLGLCTKGAT